MTVILISMFATFGQSRNPLWLTKEDFRVGEIRIDQSIDSALQFTGSPSRTDTLIVEDERFIRYSFDGLTIWGDTVSHISAVEISSRAYKTSRGISIGDSLTVVERGYGAKRKELRQKELNRVYALYDTSFSSYDYLIDYEYRPDDHDAVYIAFYFKDDHVIRMYLWRGLMD